MGTPEIVFTETELAELDEIRAKAEATRKMQMAMNQGDMPELGDEEIEIPEIGQ